MNTYLILLAGKSDPRQRLLNEPARLKVSHSCFSNDLQFIPGQSLSWPTREHVGSLSTEYYITYYWRHLICNNPKNVPLLSHTFSLTDPFLVSGAGCQIFLHRTQGLKMGSMRESFRSFFTSLQGSSAYLPILGPKPGLILNTAFERL